MRMRIAAFFSAVLFLIPSVIEKALGVLAPAPNVSPSDFPRVILFVLPFSGQR